MINEKFYDEMKEHLIENISDTFTLNLAISLWEDSKKYKVDSEYYKQALEKIKKFINSFHSLQRSTYENQHILQIIDKILGDENK